MPPKWTHFQGYNNQAPALSQTLANDQVHSGSMALKSVSGVRATSRIQRDLSGLGPTAYKHWGRVFYKVQSPSASLPASVNNGYMHITFVSLIGPASENRIVDTVQMGPGHTHQWLYNLPTDAEGSGTSSAYDWTFDADWHCAEWYVDVGTQSYRFFHDSKEVTELAFSNKPAAAMSNYTEIVLGNTYYQDYTFDTPFVAWYDDLAIDDAQIHCQ